MDYKEIRAQQILYKYHCLLPEAKKLYCELIKKQSYELARYILNSIQYLEIEIAVNNIKVEFTVY